MKYCFKCGKDYDDSLMRPKFDSRGRKIGSQCVHCINNKSLSMYGRPPAEAEGVCTTPESQVAPKIQG